MQKTLDLLQHLDLTNPKKTAAFLQQLEVDFNSKVAAGYDPLVQADNFLTEIRKLAKHPALCAESLDKMDKLDQRINQQERNDTNANNLYRLTETYQALATVINENNNKQKLKDLKQITGDYKHHLDQKFKENGFIRTETGIQRNDNKPLTSKQEKMINRYTAVVNLEETLKNKKTMRDEDVVAAKETLTTCLNNKPDWSERPFLQRFTDLLSAGLKPLYRSFFSKESQFQKEIDETLPKPKP
ncbi:MAG: hypothetical protein WC785_10200 [Tatlockia sp.]|jgi:hypothetical protein